jgi:hypothetical protein
MTPRKNDSDEMVQSTFRLRRPDWERLSMLAIRERTSIQALIVQGLNHVFKEHKLPPIK